MKVRSLGFRFNQKEVKCWKTFFSFEQQTIGPDPIKRLCQVQETAEQ